MRLDRRFKPADKLNKANEDNTFLTMENYGIVNEESYFNERITYMNWRQFRVFGSKSLNANEKGKDAMSKGNILRVDNYTFLPDEHVHKKHIVVFVTRFSPAPPGNWMDHILTFLETQICLWKWRYSYP